MSVDVDCAGRLSEFAGVCNWCGVGVIPVFGNVA